MTGVEDPPLVSVVIPAYNAAATLTECLDSVLAQRYPRIEIIVVDDGSTDETPAVLAGYRGRVRVVRQANQGLAAARNAGHAASSGELVAWLDADDVCDPDRIAIQVEYLLDRPEVGLVSTECSAFDRTGTIAERHTSTYYGMRARHSLSELYPVAERFVPSRREWLRGRPTEAMAYRGDAYQQLVWGNFVHPPTVMVRRSLLDRIGPLLLDIRTCEDWECFIRASRVAELGYIDAPLLRYRLHATQMSKSSRMYEQVRTWLSVLETSLAADPELARRYAVKARRTLGAWHSELARHSAEERPVTAVRHLFASAIRGPVWRTWFAALGIACLPRALERRLRKSVRALRNGGSHD